MDSSAGGFFKAYLRSLRDAQLAALDTWQQERLEGATGPSLNKVAGSARLADSPSTKVIADCLDKNRSIHLERKRRGRS